MGVITITIKPEGLAELRDRFPEDIETAKREIARRFQDQGRALVKSRLGRWQKGPLAKSLVAEVTQRGISMEIGAGLDYADAVFFGADKHIIRPKTGKVVAWERFGKRFAFAWVEHPGQPARTDIFDALEELFIRIVQEEVAAVIKAREIAAG